MEDAIKVFKTQQVPVLEPGQAAYRKAIATSNLLFRFTRPDCVVQPTSPAQVQTVINEARQRGLRLTIKGNGHSYAGHSTAFTGISLDLRRMKGAQLDMPNMMVTMDAGCQWGEVYEKLIIGRHDGYIINGGRCPTVGVSGFLLGGGLGPFTRSFGMGSDTLAEATLVMASGELVTVSERDAPDSDKGRLFWALRGAGGGNFGVVVQLKLHVQRLRNRRGTVVAGRYNWYPPPPPPPPDSNLESRRRTGFDNPEVIQALDTFYTTPWPDRMTIDTTWLCDFRDGTNGAAGVRFNVAFDGNKAEYNRIIQKYITYQPLAEQLQRRVLGEKSTRFLYETLVAQWLEEAETAYPRNPTYELYSSFCFGNDSPAQISQITAAIRMLMDEFRRKFSNDKVKFWVTWIHAGGKATETPTNTTAYFWRQAVFHTYVTIEWVDKWMEDEMRDFLGKVKEQLRPLSLNKEAAFINFPDRDFPTKFHERAYFGDNKAELRRVKQIWDPDKFFKWVHGVRRPDDPEEDDDGENVDRTDKLATELWGGDEWVKEWTYVRQGDLEEEFEDLEGMGYGEDD